MVGDVVDWQGAVVVVVDDGAVVVVGEVLVEEEGTVVVVADGAVVVVDGMVVVGGGMVVVDAAVVVVVVVSSAAPTVPGSTRIESVTATTTTRLRAKDAPNWSTRTANPPFSCLPGRQGPARRFATAIDPNSSSGWHNPRTGVS